MGVYRRKAQYHETDQMGIIHHSNYVKWMEEARIDFMKELGFGYGEVEKRGIVSPVACAVQKLCEGGLSLMEVVEMLDNLKEKARRDPALREMLLATRREKAPLAAFCKKCRELGVPVYEMDLIAAGEEFYAAMKRSTNGGGENSPMLEGEDDFYELFFAGLE